MGTGIGTWVQVLWWTRKCWCVDLPSRGCRSCSCKLRPPQLGGFQGRISKKIESYATLESWLPSASSTTKKVQLPPKSGTLSYPPLNIVLHCINQQCEYQYSVREKDHACDPKSKYHDLLDTSSSLKLWDRDRVCRPQLSSGSDRKPDLSSRGAVELGGGVSSRSDHSPSNIQKRLTLRTQNKRSKSLTIAPSRTLDSLDIWHDLTPFSVLSQLI